MKTRIAHFIMCSLLCLSIFIPAYAQNSNYPFSNELKEAFANRTEVEKKISSDLYSKIFTYEKSISNGLTPSLAIKIFNQKFYRIDEQNRIFVVLLLNTREIIESEAVKEQIILNNGSFKNISAGHNNFLELECWVPIDLVNQLANNKLVGTIRTPSPTYFRYTTAGDVQLKASDVRTQMNVNGTGYKVGVISTGVYSYIGGAIPFNELDYVTVINPGDIFEDEGTAMLEIIHDLAPGAQLFFYGISETQYYNNWQAAISSLQNNGCDIIVDDLYSADEPFFSDETIFGQAIRDFINDGGVYITACGNEADYIYDGTTNFVNFYNIFSNNNDYLSFTVTGGNSSFCLQWKDSWVTPLIDLEVEFYDGNGTYLFTVDNTQSALNPPSEFVYLDDGTYSIKIKSNSSNASGIEFKIFGNQFDIENNGEKHIFGHAAYPNVISVAAYDAGDETITTDFSSVGPATMYSTAIMQWTEQLVPSITATSGVQTYVGSENIWEGGYPVFKGTSASAPHIAGLAALYFHKLNGVSNLNKTNLDFISDLKLSGTTLGSGTTGGIWNAKSGYGKANILAAINRSANTVAIPIITPLSGSYYLSVVCTLSCQTPEATIKYTDDGSEPSANHGTQYGTPFTITTNKTIKAMAYKNGLIASGVKTESYVITSIVTPTVTPPNGSYPYGMKITINWPTDYRCFANYNYGDGISAPPDPPDPQSTGGGNLEFTNHPSTYTPTNVAILKMKFQLYSPSTQQWGPVVSRQYDINPSLRIAQVDEEINPLFYDNIFEGCKKWEYNNWQNQTTEFTFRPSNPTPHFLLAQQSFKDQTTRKYRLWTINGGQNNYINHLETTVGPNTSTVLAYFKNASNVTIKNKLENSFSVDQGWFYFKDPWFIDDLSDSKGPRNRGVETPQNPLTPVPMVFKSTPNITTDSDHKGVFLDQSGPPLWNPPYYSVKVDAVLDVPLTQTGKTHRFYFQNWDGTDVNYKFPTALETPVVFNQEGSVAQAVYKGTQLSNSTNAYLNNSQRKFLRTTYGTAQLNSVYEGLNRVWYEASTDGGSTWSIKNNGTPLSPVNSTSPSISTVVWSDNAWVLITFAESYDNSPLTSDIRVMRIIPSTSQIVQQLTITDGYSDGLFNNPVIASNANQSTNTHFVLVYELKTQDNFNDWVPGIYYLVGYVPVNGFYFEWLGSPTLIPGTNASSFTPAISTNYDHYTNTCEYKIVWEQRTTSTSSKIQSRTLSVTGINTWSATLSGSTINISDDCGFVKNYAPSLITMNNNVVKAVWQGARQVTADETPTGPQQINALTNWEYKTVYKDLTTGTKKVYGTKTNLPTINKLDNNSEFFFAYSEQSDLSGKVVLGSDIRTICQLDANGKDVQIGNGSTLNSVKANLFKPTTLPYYFNLSTNMEHVTPKKNNLHILSGREGIVFKDSAQFYFAVGDVLVDNIPVTFKSLSDTLNINTIGQVNEFLETEPFTLSDNSIFYYSVQYGVTDSIAAAIQLTNNRSINFKVELIDVLTGSIIGSFDDVVYSENSFYQYNNIAYQVNTAGIGNTQVKLRLLINSFGDFDYSLTERFAEESVLGKSQIKQLNLDGSGLVKEYDLAQNFPNPFNPSTTIRYQIPQDGIVTLKIYDILGSEVATLVNEEKLAGKYEVNFNASSLASGVYIYKIQAGSFINSKKMILLK